MGLHPGIARGGADGGSTHTPPPSSIPSAILSGGSPNVVQMQSSIPGNIGMITQHQHGRRNRRWYLGIQSKKDPAHVMTEVYKALLALGCEWMQLSSYRVRCRWKPNIPKHNSNDMVWNMQTNSNHRPGLDDTMDMAIDGYDKTSPQMRVITGEDGTLANIPNLCSSDYCIKIGLTLYKVQQSIYLLDFQKLTGDAFSFMTLCANIITELKNLSVASKQHQALLAQQQAARLAQLQQQKAVGNGVPQPLPPMPPRK